MTSQTRKSGRTQLRELPTVLEGDGLPAEQYLRTVGQQQYLPTVLEGGESDKAGDWEQILEVLEQPLSNDTEKGRVVRSIDALHRSGETCKSKTCERAIKTALKGITDTSDDGMLVETVHDLLCSWPTTKAQNQRLEKGSERKTPGSLVPAQLLDKSSHPKKRKAMVMDWKVVEGEGCMILECATPGGLKTC